MKDNYRKTFKRTVKDGKIIYAGFEYTSEELKKMEGKKVNVTKWGEEKGCFDISKLQITTIPFNLIFWVK